MKIFVLRHGEAEPYKTPDATRQLTINGRSEVALNITANITELLSVDTIWVSPLVRAQQTAKIAQELLAAQSHSCLIATMPMLEPDIDPGVLLAELQTFPGQALLLVSHNPLVSNFLDVFCGSEPGFHQMATSSLACVECDLAAAGLGTLRWLKHAN